MLEKSLFGGGEFKVRDDAGASGFPAPKFGHMRVDSAFSNGLDFFKRDSDPEK